MTGYHPPDDDLLADLLRMHEHSVQLSFRRAAFAEANRPQKFGLAIRASAPFRFGATEKTEVEAEKISADMRELQMDVDANGSQVLRLINNDESERIASIRRDSQ